MPRTRNEYQRCLALASYRSNSKRPSQCAEQKRRSTHQRRFHKLRKRTPNPNFSWHWAHLFIAAPQVVGCRVSSLATRRDAWHTAHSRRRGCGSPLAHPSSPESLAIWLAAFAVRHMPLTDNGILTLLTSGSGTTR